MTGLAFENLSVFVSDIAAAIKEIDNRRPQASNARTGDLYQPGIGPHPENKTVKLVVEELRRLFSERYEGKLTPNVPYPEVSRQRCDQ